MDKLLKAGKATFALVPGLLVIFTNLWLPSEIPRVLMCGIMEAIGVFTLVIFHQTEPKLKKIPFSQLKKTGVTFIVLFILCLLTYIVIYDRQDVYSSKYDTKILMPFWNNDDLNSMISKTGNIDNAIHVYGPEQIRDAINGDLGFSITKILFIGNYILIFEFLVIGFGFISIEVNGRKNIHNMKTAKN